MGTLPGIKTAIEPEFDQAESVKQRAYKEDMARPEPDSNPFSQFLSDPMPASRIEPTEPSLYERFKTNLRESVASGMFEWGDRLEAAANEKAAERLQGELKTLQEGGQGDTLEAKRKEMELSDAAFQADAYVTGRKEEKFQYENMPWSDTPMEWAASIGGGLAGSIDPTIAIGEVKIGTTAWRYGAPMISRMLDYGVTNAVTGAAMDVAAQAGDTSLDIQDEIDWSQVVLNAGIGGALGVPFGYLSGRALRDEQDAERVLGQLMQQQEPDAPPADLGPRIDQEPPPAPTPEQSTVESVSSKHAPDDLAAAQEALFGEVLGTRNLTPEQLNQVDDYLSAGSPYDPNPPEAMPTVRDAPPAESQPLPPVREPGQPESGPDARAPDEKAAPAPLVAGDYQDFRPEELKVDAKRFQYKGGGDEEGVVDTLKKVKSWDRKKSGTIIVWQDMDGNNFVVDGHQRYGLAKRLKGEGQDPVLHAMIWKEADGITADEARIMAADINISQGSGTAIDAAKILRARPDFLKNLPSNQVTEHAKGLALLSDDAFGMVVNGAVPPEYAGLVGKLAPNKETHAQIMDVLAKNEPASAAQAESMVRDVLAAPEVESTMADMFGSAEVTQILFRERAQVLSSAVAAIRKDRAAFNMLVKEEARIAGAGNKLATETNLQRTRSDAEILATLQATARRKGPVADALAAAAKSLYDGTPRQVAVRDFIDRIRGETGSASPDGAGLPASPQSIAARIIEAGRTFDPRIAFSTKRKTDYSDPLLNWQSPESIATTQRIQDEMDRMAALPEVEKPAAAEAFHAKLKAGGFEKGADNKPQSVLPGAERITDKTLAERKAAAPLKPGKAQKDMDFGLFGDGGNQLDLVDLTRSSKPQGTLFMSRQETDYLDFRPTGAARTGQLGKASVSYAVRDGEVEIISFRVPVMSRRQGEGREAMMAFLEKADDEGLKVRAYSTPLDRGTDKEGIIRFYESLGFTSTGRKIDRNGNVEMLRSGPPPEVAELRKLVGSGRLIPLRDYTDPAMAQEVSRAFYGAQPARTLEELYDGGILQKRQDELDKAGKAIAETVGADFKSPGIKKKETAQQKIIRKRYRSTKQLTDLVRAGFTVDTPDQAQRIVNMLAEKFQILDEGWNISPVFYFDRKLSVRFTDGTIGEVQFWHPDLLVAKNEVGHSLYEQSRMLPPGPEREMLEQAQVEIYSSVISTLDPSWAGTLGRGGNWPNVPENSARMADSSGRSLPESDTSGASTSSQSSPGSNTDQANPPSMIAGRPSQSANFMGSSVSRDGRGSGGRPQAPGSEMDNSPQAWRDLEITAMDEAGKPVKVNAGDAVDFMVTRVKALKQLLDCVNAN